MTRDRWIEVARILITGLVILLYARGLLPLPALLAAVAIGLYPLVRSGIRELAHVRSGRGEDPSWIKGSRIAASCVMGSMVAEAAMSFSSVSRLR